MVKKVIDIIPPQRKEAAIEKEEPLTEPVKKPDQLKPKITYIKSSTTPRRREFSESRGRNNRSSKAFYFLKLTAFILVLFAFGFFLDLKLSKAQIKIWPRTELIKTDIKIAVDPEAKTFDIDKKMISGVKISAQQDFTDEFLSSGKKSTENRAQGMIKIYNNYSSAQRLVKGTRFQAPLDKFKPALSKDETPWFKTQEEVVILAKSSKEVRVVADGVGEKYNIEPSVFSIPGLVGTAQYTFVYGQSFEKFQGGDEKEVPLVTEEDINRAKSDMTKKSEEEIKKILEKQVPSGYVLISETVEAKVTEVNSASPAGSVLEKFKCQAKAEIQGIAFKKEDLGLFIKEFILTKTESEQKIIERSFQVGHNFTSFDAVSKQPVLSVTTEAKTYIPLDENELKKGLAETKTGEAAFFLRNQPNIKNIEIEISPFWRTKIPKDLDKIQVETILE